MKPMIDTVCQFCCQPCFVPLTEMVPRLIVEAYVTRGVNMLATCESGRRFEKALLGYSLDDIEAAIPDYVETMEATYAMVNEV